MKNRVALQDSYECYFIIADLHTLTTKAEKEHLAQLDDNIYNVVLDYLSVGIDPEKSVIFLQSAIPEEYELAQLLGNLVTLPRLTRLPSIKDMARAASMDDETVPFGLIGCTRFCKPRTSCSRALTWFPWARTTRHTWRSRARSRAASTICTT